MIIRPARIDELEDLSKLCLRAKAYWPYDEAFIAACRDELTLTERHLADDIVRVADENKQPAGVLRLVFDGISCELEMLFVDPAWIGKGVGRQLFRYAAEIALAEGATVMDVVSDPNAASFYQHMGFVQFGTYPSGSIAGRELPHLRLKLGDQ